MSMNKKMIMIPIYLIISGAVSLPFFMNAMEAKSYECNLFTLLYELYMIFLVFLFGLVFQLLANSTSKEIYGYSKTSMGTMIEIYWTFLPLIIILMLVFPCLWTLYAFNNVTESSHLKVTGHQWYWSYENPYDSEEVIDSYMAGEDTTIPSEYWYLYEVDNWMKMPSGTLSISTSSTDVIHAFSLPKLNIKLDAVPGRLNTCTVSGVESAIYYGQCSEICGANHAFMPIKLELE